ncbi:hypothetical protein DBR11_04645 [Pedobacter sp. HMWF019]|uniref:hypothetical protein n=1 Tax=Pedobacter sp. HMWF019 TaxID=2056856 RepID=UPI000D3AFA76|nr:hypothetical protein [Pedobacter sp. HMWF019]PTT02468.1 hypothetical protein DBR11_04645 [Pedobacter sp. HMWF019]
MGLKADWLREIKHILEGQGIHAENAIQDSFKLLLLKEGKLILNLISLDQYDDPEELLSYQFSCFQEGIQVIHLWEDIWQSRKEQVLSRLKSVMGLNQRLHGRSTSVEKISKEDAESFLEQYHIQGSAGGRYRYALQYKGEAVAVAVFSHKRKMKGKGEDYTSAELVRFATKDGITVIGGMTKLIKHYLRLFSPNDLMSYADRDWSVGNAYRTAGFELVAETPPSPLYVDPVSYIRYFLHRVPEESDQEKINSYIQVFNTGNLKYVLYQ